MEANEPRVELINKDGSFEDYEYLLSMIRKRLEHIDELSKEDETFNKEWLNLRDMENSLWRLVRIVKI